jgi:M6 family metalloprotease-like protein
MIRLFKVLVLVVLVAVGSGQSISTLATVVYAWPPYRAVIGPQSVIVITLDFSDARGSFSTDHVEDLVFNKTNEYFKEVSYEHSWIVGNITRKWYELSGASASYAWDNVTDPWRFFKPFIQTVVRLADREVDYSKYRYVAIVHSGRWRNSWGFVDPYTISTQDGTFTVNIPIISLYHSDSVFAHEFAHVFGNLPDMYGIVNEQYLPIFVGPWDLMSQSDNRHMQHLSAWSKIKAGWISSRAVVTVSKEEAITATVDPLELPTSGIIALKIPLTAKTYYILEVRQKIGLDSLLPDYGVVVYLVDETKTTWGESPLIVQDSNPDTSTLDDAPFDLSLGKQAGFFDRKNNISIVIAGKSGLSYTVFVGPASS